MGFEEMEGGDLMNAMRVRVWMGVSLFLWPGPLWSVDRDAAVVTVLGAPGTEEYGKKFSTVAKDWQVAGKRGKVRLVELGAKPGDSGKTVREQLRAVIAAEIERGTSALWLVLIGHGTFDGRETKFNVPGPDFTDREVAEWLKPFKGTLVVVNSASSSAPFVKALSGENRIIVTATKSAEEIYYPRFGEYFARAIGGLEAADLDHDGQVSLLEAFLYAGHEVKAFFEKEGRIATEHAMLDDNGDRRGARVEEFEGVLAIETGKEKDGAGPDGERAHQIHLVTNKLEALMPEKARVRRDELELRVKALRRKRGEMEEEAYYRDLEALLLEIARIYERVEGGGS